MPTYLITNRPPAGYRPPPRAAKEWNAWFASLRGYTLVEVGELTVPAIGVPTCGL